METNSEEIETSVDENGEFQSFRIEVSSHGKDENLFAVFHFIT